MNETWYRRHVRGGSGNDVFAYWMTNSSCCGVGQPHTLKVVRLTGSGISTGNASDAPLIRILTKAPLGDSPTVRAVSSAIATASVRASCASDCILAPIQCRFANVRYPEGE